MRSEHQSATGRDRGEERHNSLDTTNGVIAAAALQVASRAVEGGDRTLSRRRDRRQPRASCSRSIRLSSDADPVRHSIDRQIYTAQLGETNGPMARAIIPPEYRGLFQAPEDCPVGSRGSAHADRKRKFRYSNQHTKSGSHRPLLKPCTAPVDELGYWSRQQSRA